VRSGGRIRRRPARSWNRRSPARVADTCAGYLAAVVAHQAGKPEQRFLDYGDRHNKRTLLPMAFMVAGHIADSARPDARRSIAATRRIIRIVRIIRDVGTYAWSHQFTADPPDVRTAWIREALMSMAAEGGIGDVLQALEPFIDFLAAKVAEDAEPEFAR
jgi:hypothetical protein